MTVTNLDHTNASSHFVKNGVDEIDICEVTGQIETDPRISHGMAPVSRNAQQLQQIGTYRIVKKLGAGGMGAVYLGIDERDNSEVAIKVLTQDAEPDLDAVRRFEKEAKLLGEVNHPHVSNLRDAGEWNGVFYLVMDYVNGIDLKVLLAVERKLSEYLALGIIRDICDALAEAHSRGIVHSDIKPANVMLVVEEVPGQEAVHTLSELIRGGHHPMVKLTDFGLARHVDQSESMAMTKTGAMLGTPYYLSPEQCSGQYKISPATDIYALGITLFQILAGRPPFQAPDPVKLITMHSFEEAPDIRKHNPEVSDGVAALIERCLQKTPDQRFADGAHLRDEIDRLLRGETNDVAIHPIVPEVKSQITEAVWEWDLKSTPQELWPLVSNTERINQAVGLPSVDYQTERDENGQIRRFGSFKLGFSKLTWEEHPFEWVEGKRLGVLREFKNGSFHWFASIVELQPLSNGGTILLHRVRVATRGMLGRFLAHLEVNVKGRKNLDQVYKRIDSVIAKKSKQVNLEDPFESPAKLTRSIQQRIQSRVERLDSTQVDQDSLDYLIRHLTDSPAQELARIRPYAIAEKWGLDKQIFSETCLQACTVGLLELHWDILCPTCRISSDIKDTIADIDKHSYCEACDLEFETDFQNAIEVFFRVHPEIRKADLKTYCIGGPEHAPHVVAQARMSPGEKLEFDLALDAGTYTLRGPQLPYTAQFIAESNQGAIRTSLKLSQKFDTRCKTRLQAGRQLLTLENGYEIPLLVRLERTVLNQNVLTAADASRIAMFRELFPDEVLSREQLTDYTTCTLLGIRITDLEALFEASSESGAFRMLSQKFETLCQSVVAYRGQVIKQAEDRILAAFPETNDALELTHSLLKEQQTREFKMPLGVTLHRGTTMTTTMNGQMDYFGRVVTTANQMLERAVADGLLLSSSLAQDIEVTQGLKKMNVFPEKSGEQSDRVFRLKS
ncbi:MAG TPA: hypothetical protein DD473_19950 [Planctomycetaceae bacterium]|nr:hypothetical protein [Planctomycetaceae bacterium]